MSIDNAETKLIKRNTIQCEMVADAVKALGCHATADEVYAEVAKKYPNIGRGTVYRNLQKLCENGTVRKVEVPDGADRYDHITKDHYHVKCAVCGKLFDVGMPYMNGLEKSAQSPKGFVITGHELVFKGICPDCNKHREENKREVDQK